MRILVFAEAMGGGVLSVIRDQYNIVKSANPNWEYTIVYCERPETPSYSVMKQIFSGADVINMQLGRSDSFFLIKAIRKLLGLGLDKYDVIHLHSSYAGFVGRLIHPLYSGKIFYTPHCYAFLGKSGLKKALLFFAERMLAKKGSVIACGDTEHALAEQLGSRSFLVRNGIAFPDRFNEAEKNYDIVSVGRFAAQKGPDVFKKLISLACERGLSHLWIGNYEGSAVNSTGWCKREDVLTSLARGRVYVSTARWEGLPVAPIEAMHFGLPVVGISAPGFNDVISSGYNGFICSDESEMLEKILLLLTDDEVYNSMSINAKAFVSENFSLRNYERLIDIYKFG